MMTSVLLTVVAAADSALKPEWSSGAGLGQFFKVFAALLFVIALAWVTLSLLRRFMGKSAGRAGAIEAVGGLSLGPRRALQLVRLGETVYLLGVTDHHISRIAEINDPKAVADLTSAAAASPVGFGEFLRRARGHGGSGKSGGDSA